jgi:3-deoxy-D-manno-octulosonate 8-phosphate phosphatase (KDO 8-P phosphatase)
MPKLFAQARARKIKLLLFDVDGVLTDGKLFIFPAPAGSQQSVLQQSAQHGGQGGGKHSESMIEAKGFHAHDGASISLARLGGIRTGLITKRVSETVALRARDLKLEFVYQGVDDKRTCFNEVVHKASLKAEEAAFVGDDVIDLPAMRASGLAIAVKNARAEAKSELHHAPRRRRRCTCAMPSSSFSKPKANGNVWWKITSAREVRRTAIRQRQGPADHERLQPIFLESDFGAAKAGAECWF